MALIDRVKKILLVPKTEWMVISGETPTVQSLFSGYILILAALGPIAMALRGGMFGPGLGIALVSYAIGLVMVYLMAWIVDLLAPTFGGENDFIRSLQLVAYSYTAAWVAGIFHLIPVVGSILALLAVIYTFYTFHLGVPILKKCPPNKATAYTIVVVLCGMALGFALSYVLFAMVIGGSVTGMMGTGMR
jgi:hypothetical protein